MKRIIGILAITVLMSVNFALATGNDNAQLDSKQDGSKINLNPKNLPICDSQPYDNCFGVLGHYTGEFHNGNYNGFGKLSWLKTAYFIGEFKDDKKNGHFSLYDNEKRIFEGDYINGMQSGNGIYYYANGDINKSCVLYRYGICKNDYHKSNGSALNMPNVPAKKGEVIALKPKGNPDPYKEIPDGGGYVPKENEVYKSNKLPTYVNAVSEQDSNKSSLNLVAINSNSFLDKNSLQRFGSIVRVWIYVDLTNKPITQWNGPLTNPVYSVRHQEDINCSNKTYQTLELHWYSLPNFTGVEIDTTDVGTRNVLSIPRGTIEDKIYYMYCDENGNRGATEASNANAESANDLTRLQILQQQQILDQQDQQRRTQLLNEAQRLLGPAKSTNCTSTMVGNTVQTNCY